MLREADFFEPGQEVLDTNGHRVRLASLNIDVQHHDASRPLWVGVDLDGVYTLGDVAYTQAGYVDIATSSFQAYPSS